MSGNPIPMKSTNKGLYLSVPTPCEENWSQMTRTAAGRHCSSCNKTVVDFSILSDAAIFAVIANSNGTVCGRFSDDQLQREISGAMPVRHHFMPAMAITAGLAVGMATATHAEKNSSSTVLEMQPMPGSSVGSASLEDTASLAVAASPADSVSPEIRHLPEVVVTGASLPVTRTMLMGTTCVSEVSFFTKVDYDPVYYSGRHLINKLLRKKKS